MASALQNYSHYSVLQSILKPADIIELFEDKGYEAAAITDLNSMAGVVQFFSKAKDANIKPILGCTYSFMDGSTIVFLAKNYNGYKTLLKILSRANSKKNYFKQAQISKELLLEFDLSDLICLTGHYGSDIYNTVVQDYEINENAEELLSNRLGFLLSFISKANIYFQVEPSFSNNLKKIYYDVGLKNNIKVAQTNQVRFSDDPENEYLYDIIKATKFKIKVDALEPDKEIYYPFEIECKITDEIVSKISEYNILKPQKLPKFSTPNKKDSIEYLKDICRQEYKEKIDSKDTRYLTRIKKELEVFEKHNLADYFLVLWDVIKFAESKHNMLLGCARGSSGGSLISYLLNITKIDPIKYKLIFERFFNEGRVGSMPDIDVDFPKRGREKIIDYVKNKYGEKHTGQIVTYQTFMGRAAIKAVLRAEGKISFSEMNDITKAIEDKSKISDELQQMKESGREPSVIMWALENKAHKLSQWVRLDEKSGKLTGPLADQFENAIKLEGIKSAQSRHAAGIVISDPPLEEIVPIIYDEKSKKQIVGIEYEDAEQLSCVKYDFLGISTLDRLEDI